MIPDRRPALRSLDQLFHRMLFRPDGTADPSAASVRREYEARLDALWRDRNAVKERLQIVEAKLAAVRAAIDGPTDDEDDE